MKLFLLFLSFIPLISWATINPTLIESIGDTLYFEADDGETYDCAEVQSLVEEGQTIVFDTWTQSFCQLVGTRQKLLTLTDKIQQAVGTKEKISLDEPERNAFLKEHELTLFLEKEKEDLNSPGSVKDVLQEVSTEHIEELLESKYSYQDEKLDDIEKNVKKNREFFFSLDVQGKSLADLSFERSLKYGDDREQIRGFCRKAFNLQEKLKCDNLYQILTIKTMYEMLGISSLNSGVSIINIYGGL